MPPRGLAVRTSWPRPSAPRKPNRTAHGKQFHAASYFWAPAEQGRATSALAKASFTASPPRFAKAFSVYSPQRRLDFALRRRTESLCDGHPFFSSLIEPGGVHQKIELGRLNVAGTGACFADLRDIPRGNGLETSFRSNESRKTCSTCSPISEILESGPLVRMCRPLRRAQTRKQRNAT